MIRALYFVLFFCIQPEIEDILWYYPSRASPTMNFAELPQEILAYFLKFCTPAQRAILRATCRAFRIEARKRVKYLDWVDYGSVAIVRRVITPLSYRDIAALSITRGQIDIMRWAASICSHDGLSKALYYSAVEANNIHAMQALFDMEIYPTYDIFTVASARGMLEIIKWLYANKCPINSWAMYTAINNCNDDVVHWLIDVDCPVDRSTYDIAFNRGRFDIIHKLTVRGYSCFIDDGKLGYYFAHAQSIPTLEYIFSNADILSDSPAIARFVDLVIFGSGLNHNRNVIAWIREKQRSCRIAKKKEIDKNGCLQK